MMLSKEDRERFAAYLEQDAADTDKLIAQLGAIPTGGILALQMRAERDAERLIAHKLRMFHPDDITRRGEWR